jgi:two-component sensor histidine kinase
MMESAAFGILLSNLLETMLADASNPVDCALHLSEQIRGLIGVKTVLVYECNGDAETPRHALLAATPARRRELGQSAQLMDLAELSHNVTKLTVVRPQQQNPEASPIENLLFQKLVAIENQTSIIVPLQYADKRTGVMLLLGLMDEHNIGNLVQTVNRLSGVLALVLKNAMLYSNLEGLVESRTAELRKETRNLMKSLENNRVLFKEVHHRVKNNLQIIDSLLYLQGESLNNEETRFALADARGRIGAMALVHAELYRTDDLTSIDLSSYISGLVSSVLSSAPHTPLLVYDLIPVSVPLEVCIPCGLIINEVVTNAIKYALMDKEESQLHIKLIRFDKKITIEIKDQGPGFPDLFDPLVDGNLGFSIIRSLATQLDGHARWLNQDGVLFILTFDLEQH